MMKIPLNASTFDEEEISAAIAVLRSGQVTMGAKCLEFEAAFAEYMGVNHAIFVNSGSSANLLAFFAFANPLVPLSDGKRRMEPGCEVIVPAVTWSTTVWPIVQAGGTPVLVDSDPETLQMRIEDLERAISPRTVAICPVHVLGNAVPMEPVLALARKHKLWVMEDTCEALGTKQNRRFVGTKGDIGTFSFFFSHHITTIEGGMIVTNDDAMAELFRTQRAHGWTRHLKDRKSAEAKHPDMDPRFLFINTGFNVRPTEINAAFGIPQLKKLAGFNRRRVEIAEQLNRELGYLAEKGLMKPMRSTEGTESTWFGFPVLLRDRASRDAFREYLEQKGVETRPIICGNLARQPAFKHINHRISGSGTGSGAGRLAGADAIMDQGIYWGLHPTMRPDEIAYVIQTVKDYFA